MSGQVSFHLRFRKSCHTNSIAIISIVEPNIKPLNTLALLHAVISGENKFYEVTNSHFCDFTLVKEMRSCEMGVNCTIIKK